MQSIKNSISLGCDDCVTVRIGLVMILIGNCDLIHGLGSNLICIIGLIIITSLILCTYCTTEMPSTLIFHCHLCILRVMLLPFI